MKFIFYLKPIIVISACLLLGARSYSQDRNTPAGLRERQWQEDLDIYETNMPQKHIDFYKLMPKEKFEREMADIKNSVPSQSDAEIIFRLMRLTARLGIAHTRIAMPASGPCAFHRYPITFRWYSNGLIIVAAAPGYENALGARVVRIGSLRPERLESRLAPYISHENKFWLHEESPDYMRSAELLEYLNVTSTNGVVELILAKAGGKPFTLQVAPVAWSAATNQISVKDFLHFPGTLSQEQPDAFYWYQYLPDTRTLYLQYNVCENDPKHPFKNFARNFFTCADSNSVQRLVVDLRFNGGGNSEVINPLLKGIQARPSLNTHGHLYVLIGPGTFSSGEMAAEEFGNRFQRFHGQHFNATLVGEPTGGKPNCYGDVEVFKLSNAKLTVRYSTKHFQLSTQDDPPAREPDVRITQPWDDYRAGRDAALNYALESGE